MGKDSELETRVALVLFRDRNKLQLETLDSPPGVVKTPEPATGHAFPLTQ